MIPSMDGRQRAARAVAARQGELGMTQRDLADAAGVDIKTINSLVRRGRWPIARNRALIEKALAWPLGELERIAAQDEPEQADPVAAEMEVLHEAISGSSLPPDRAARLERIVEAALRGELPPRRRQEPPARAG